MKTGTGTSNMRKGLGGFGLLITFMFVALAPHSARSQCSDPSGGAGDMMYSSIRNVMQYCDDSDWVAMGTVNNHISTLDDGLVAYWKLDETSTPSLSQTGSFNMTWNGTPSSVTGYLDNAVGFSANTQFLSTPSNASLEGFGELTLAAWVYPTGAPGTNWGRIVSKSDATVSDDYALILRAGSMEVGMRVNGSTEIYSNVVLTPNTRWYHVVGTVDSAGNMRIYVDGVQQDIVSGISLPLQDSNQPLAIGRHASSTTRDFVGRIDEVRVYNRALTTEEIIYLRDLFETEEVGSIDLAAGLVSHWRMEETTGTAVADAQGANNGTFTGAASVTSVAGAVDNAIEFDGVNDRLEVGNFDVSGSGITLAAWVYMDADTTDPRIIAKASNGAAEGDHDWAFIIGSGLRTPRLRLQTVGGVEDMDAGYSLPLDQWHHLAFTYDDTIDRVSFYADGVLVDTMTHSFGGAVITGSGENVAIGNMPAAAADNVRPWDGYLDEVVVYDRPLNKSEIRILSGTSGDGVCGNPFAIEGTMMYNASTAQMQYCNGAGWASMGPPGGFVTPTDGLTGHWKLDETSGSTAADSAGSNNGTINGTATWTTGQLDGALSFNGSTNHINTALSLAAYPITGCAWTNLSTGTATTSTIIGTSDTAPFALNIVNDSGSNDYLQVYNNVTSMNTYGGSIALGSWQHVCVTINASRSANLYINGTRIAGPSTLGAPTFPGNIKIGAYGNSNINEPTGTIDDVRIYNRVLTEAEIGALFFTTAGTFDITSDIIGHWRFDESSGTSAADATGNGNTGTLNLFPASPWQPTGGQIDGALLFDNVDSYVSVANESNFDFERTDPFSVSAWIYRNNNGSEDQIISKYTNPGGNYRGYGMWMTVGLDNVLFSLENSGASGRIQVTANTGSAGAGEWHHVVMTYDGSSSASGVRIYVDGIDQALFVYQDDLSATTLNNTNLMIGDDSYDPGCCTFNGRIDDVRVYDRELTSTDVAGLYSAGIGGSDGTCSGPEGRAGTMIYNSTHDIMQYCNGDDWVPIGKIP